MLGRLPALRTALALDLWGEREQIPTIRAMLNLLALIPLVRRNAIWIAAVGVVAALLCVIAIRLIFDQYSATATILFDPRNAKVTGAEQVLPDIGPDSIAIESLVQVAKSDAFLSSQLAEREGLSGGSRIYWQRRVGRRPEGGGARKITRPSGDRAARRDLCG